MTEQTKALQALEEENLKLKKELSSIKNRNYELLTKIKQVSK